MSFNNFYIIDDNLKYDLQNGAAHSTIFTMTFIRERIRCIKLESKISVYSFLSLCRILTKPLYRDCY